MAHQKVLFELEGVPFVGIFRTRALLFGVHIRAPDGWKLSFLYFRPKVSVIYTWSPELSFPCLAREFDGYCS